MKRASKLLELSFVLPLVAAEGDLEPLPCDACGTVHNPAQMACVPSLAGEAIGISWVCAGCLPETNRTRGENLQGCRPVAIEKVDKILLDVGDSIDHDILRKRNFAPYVRRVLFAERERARLSGKPPLPFDHDDMAVVVQRQDEKRFKRTLLPMPFPWAEAEFIAGKQAALEALAMVNEIKNGNATLDVFCGAFLATSTPEAYKRVIAAGRV